ncbi:MAG: hypothetical protein JSU89_13130, partial [Myxococcales bacterium]
RAPYPVSGVRSRDMPAYGPGYVEADMMASPVMSETTCPIGYASFAGKENAPFELGRRPHRDGTGVATVLGKRS